MEKRTSSPARSRRAGTTKKRGVPAGTGKKTSGRGSKSTRGNAGARRSAPSKRATAKTAKRGAKSRPASDKTVARTDASRRGTAGMRGAPRKKCTAAQKKAFREMLLELRSRISDQIAVLKSESLQRTDEVNTLEDGTDAFDRQMALELASSEQHSLAEIDDALRRIDDGSYGICESCSDQIESPRLRALPFVRNCIKCQSEIERKGNGPRRVIMDVSSEA